jgi:hypothetical protein
MSTPHLRHDKHTIAMATEEARQCPLAVPLTINIGRIEEIDASFDGGLKGRLDFAHWHGVTY